MLACCFWSRGEEFVDILDNKLMLDTPLTISVGLATAKVPEMLIFPLPTLTDLLLGSDLHQLAYGDVTFYVPNDITTVQLPQKTSRFTLKDFENDNLRRSTGVPFHEKLPQAESLAMFVKFEPA